VHLAGVSVVKRQLQIEDDQAAQAPVEEEQIYAIPFVVDAQRRWRPTKVKCCPVQKKGFEVADEGIFQVALGILIAQAEKFEDQGMTNSRRR